MSAKYRTSPDHELTGWPKGVKAGTMILTSFFWIFAGMFAAGVLFAIRAAFYTYRDYTQ